MTSRKLNPSDDQHVLCENAYDAEVSYESLELNISITGADIRSDNKSTVDDGSSLVIVELVKHIS